MSDDVVWIRSTVETGLQVDVEFFDIPREEWEAKTEEQRYAYLVEVAVQHQTNIAPCGAAVVDESEVPQDYKDWAEG